METGRRQSTMKKRTSFQAHCELLKCDREVLKVDGNVLDGDGETLKCDKKW